MSISREEILAALAPDEIDYPAAAAHLGSEAIPLLLELIKAGDVLVAPKATYLAAAISRGEDLQNVIDVAAVSSDPVTRIASATLFASLGATASTQVLTRLLQDEDIGVRKCAVAAAKRFNTDPGVRARLKVMAVDEPVSVLRDLSLKTLQ